MMVLLILMFIIVETILGDSSIQFDPRNKSGEIEINKGSLFSCTIENADENDKIIWTLDNETLTQEVRYEYNSTLRQMTGSIFLKITFPQKDDIFSCASSSNSDRIQLSGFLTDLPRPTNRANKNPVVTGVELYPAPGSEDIYWNITDSYNNTVSLFPGESDYNMSIEAWEEAVDSNFTDLGLFRSKYYLNMTNHDMISQVKLIVHHRGIVHVIPFSRDISGDSQKYQKIKKNERFPSDVIEQPGEHEWMVGWLTLAFLFGFIVVIIIGITIVYVFQRKRNLELEHNIQEIQYTAAKIVDEML